MAQIRHSSEHPLYKLPEESLITIKFFNILGRYNMPSTIHIIGIPMDLGQGRRGVDMGTSAIRYAGIGDQLKELGYKVIDDGDFTIKTPEEQRIRDPHAKYLPEIARSCSLLARKVETIVNHGHFPLVI